MKEKSRQTKLVQISANELLELTSQQWATVNDIRIIGHCGENKAQKIKRQIKEKIKTELGKDVPFGVVPMEYVVDYFSINTSYLKKVAKKELADTSSNN